MRAIVRTGLPDDVEAVLAINRHSVPGEPLMRRSDFAHLVSACEHFSVVDAGGKVAGYILAMSQDAAYAGELIGHHGN